MKHLIYTILILISACLGFFFVRYDWYTDINSKHYPYNIKEHLDAEHEYANALFEGLHWYMRDDSTYWDTVFKNTVEFVALISPSLESSFTSKISFPIFE